MHGFSDNDYNNGYDTLTIPNINNYRFIKGILYAKTNGYYSARQTTETAVNKIHTSASEIDPLMMWWSQCFKVESTDYTTAVWGNVCFLSNTSVKLYAGGNTTYSSITPLTWRVELWGMK